MLISSLAATGCAKPNHYHADIQSENAGDRILAIRQAADTGDKTALPLIVDRLDDEDDGVRFFAIIALQKITGMRMGYDYADPADRRARAVDRWRDYVKTQPADAAGPKAGMAAPSVETGGARVEGGVRPR